MNKSFPKLTMNNRSKKIILLFGDIILFFLSITLTVGIVQKAFVVNEFLFNHLKLVAILSPLWCTIYFIEGLYSLRTFNRNGLVITLLRSSAISSLMAIVFLYLFGTTIGVTPKTNLIIFTFLTLLLSYLWRRCFFSLFSYKVFMRDISFIGTSKDFDEVEESILKRKHLGFYLVEKYNHFSQDIKKTSLLIIEDKLLRTSEIELRLFDILNKGTSILTLSEFSEIVLGKIPVNAIDHSWFIDSKMSIKQGTYHYTKELLDRMVAIIGLIICIPIFIFLLPALVLFSGRPFLYSQERVGLNNKNYTIYKLRTMRNDAEKDGVQWSTQNDSRITRIGSFLRSTRLDELPQLWNVLNGTMSIVGPRPERPEIIKEKLQKVIPFYDYRHLAKPGITGWAQVNYGYGSTENDSLIKLQYDLFYVKNRTHWLDIRIALKTIAIILKKLGR